MAGEIRYFLKWHKKPPILPTSLVMDRIHRFHLGSGMNLSLNKRSRQRGLLRIQLFIRFSSRFSVFAKFAHINKAVSWILYATNPTSVILLIRLIGLTAGLSAKCFELLRFFIFFSCRIYAGFHILGYIFVSVHKPLDQRNVKLIICIKTKINTECNRECNKIK